MKTASPSEFLAGCRFLSALKVVQRGVQRAFFVRPRSQPANCLPGRILETREGHDTRR
jgi:hypothetical protein